MSNLHRPLRYRQGQRRAIDMLGFPEMDKSLSILDVGCGIGAGMLHFQELGFTDVFGIDTDADRICLARRRKLNAVKMSAQDLDWMIRGSFDLVWLSHSFEHFKRPKYVLDMLVQWCTSERALFFFILPYPDLYPSELHIASKEIGLNIDDNGKTVIKWFEDRGLELLYSKRDDFREPEIWLKFRKK